MSAVRRSLGFCRYALSIQYHGSSFLGFAYQGELVEDCITSNGTDLRGYQSVEGRLRDALESLVGEGNFENIQVSSRTDRGVHALKNTLHVDIRHRTEATQRWDPKNIANGLNFLLRRQHRKWADGEKGGYLQLNKSRRQPHTQTFWGSPPHRYSPPHELCILGAAEAPLSMQNVFYTGGDDDNQPRLIDWNARFSATSRAYAYRLFHLPSSHECHSIPFEWDKSWILRHPHPLDIEAMSEAARYLTGTHDFSSFRAKDCARASPVVTMKNIAIQRQRIDSLGMGQLAEMLGLEPAPGASLVTIGFVGDSFLYRQVRNMVGCLVEVGRQKLKPTDVCLILEERDRAKAPSTAPAHGLFLVDVQHGDFVV